MPCHRSKSNRANQQPEEIPQFQFRNPSVPGGWLQLILQRKITPNEFILAIIIDSYVQRNGPGCWASNRYLASQLNVEIRSIPRMISKLREMGHVISYEKNGKRHLETSWSRLLENNQTFCLPHDAQCHAPHDAQCHAEEEIRKKKKKAAGAPLRPLRKNEAETRNNKETKPQAQPDEEHRRYRRCDVARSHKDNVVDFGAVPSSPQAQSRQEARNCRKKRICSATILKEDESFAKTKSAPRVILCNTKEKNVSLFDQTQSDKITLFDLDCAERLHHCIVKVLKITRKWSRRAWADDFRQLRVSMLDCDELRLDRVLSWYCDHAAEIVQPRIQNAKHFRNTFLWLEDQAGDIRYTEVSPEAQCVADEVKNMGWPSSFKEQLGPAAQQTIDNVHDLQTRIVPLIEHYKAQRVVRNGKKYTSTRFTRPQHLYEHLRDSFGNPQQFAVRWLRRINERLQNWPEFSGKLTTFIWKHDSKVGRQFGQELVGGFTSDFTWDDVVKEVYGEGR